MDKFFNLFKNKKEEKTETTITNTKKEGIITTQNLENFANISDPQNEKNNSLNKDEENITTNKSINFTNDDINNIKDIMNIKENLVIQQEKINTQKDNKIAENSFSPDKKINTTKIIGDVVTVNSYETFKTNTKGFYTNKYKEKVQSLKSVIFKLLSYLIIKV